MAKASKKASGAQPQGEAPEVYYILDKGATHVAGHRITDDHRKKGILLTASEAAMHVASGTISTSDPNEDKAAAEVQRKATAAATPAGKEAVKTAGTSGTTTGSASAEAPKA